MKLHERREVPPSLLVVPSSAKNVRPDSLPTLLHIPLTPGGVPFAISSSPDNSFPTATFIDLLHWKFLIQLNVLPLTPFSFVQFQHAIRFFNVKKESTRDLCPPSAWPCSLHTLRRSLICLFICVCVYLCNWIIEKRQWQGFSSQGPYKLKIGCLV